MKVTRVRSFLKTLTFRVLATFITMVFVFVFTGNMYITFGVGSLEFMSKSLLYYLHERVWNRINFGRLD